MPRKVFTAGEILTAADVNTNLMDQSVMVFAGTAARGSAIPSPTEGMVTYRSDDDVIEVYDGSAFVGVAPDATPTVRGVVLGKTASSNAALGSNALVNSTGILNVAVGVSALTENTSGGANTAVGNQAARDNTTGESNTAVGYLALAVNTTASNNTAIGRGTLRANTTGIENTAVGHIAMQDSTTGIENTAVGRVSLFKNTTGGSNTAIGVGALFNNTTGSTNTGLGRSAGLVTTTGSNNTSVGHAAAPTTATVSNQVTLGNSSVATLRCQQTSITALSDVRDKTDVEETVHGLDLIKKLRPVDFTWNTRDGSKVGVPDVGFIAQELAELEDDLGETDRLRLTLRDNPEKLEATPGRLLPILVKAVQQLSAENDELKARLDKLENK